MDRIRQIVLLITISSLSFCTTETKNSEVVPANILYEDRFAEILADFALAESAANLNIKNASLSAMDSLYAFDPLKFRGIRTSQYDSTLHYYSLHPKKYQAAYEKALTRLTEIESRSEAKTDSMSKK